MRKYFTAAAAAAFMLLLPVTARADFSFEKVEDVEFYFASGAGGWDTHLMIGADGSFTGNYHDSDMGDTGEEYPNGTLYFCDFTGSFTQPEKLDEYTYTFEMDALDLLRKPGEEETVDGIRYVYSDAYGLDDAETFYMYLPGKPLEELPEEYLGWVGYYDLSKTEDTVLPFYGLYNEKAQEGFSGYKIPDEDPAEAGFISGLISQTEEKTAGPAKELEEGNLPQQQLNMESYELFRQWDDTLNEIWAYLKETLDTEAMDALTQEELTWIAEKEADVRKEGSAFEGGSMQPFAENMTAYRWTKDRVYELRERYGAQDTAAGR